jgi:hypothetical protein
MSTTFVKYITRLLLVLSLVTQSIAIAMPVCDMEMGLSANLSSNIQVEGIKHDIAHDSMDHSAHNMYSDATNQNIDREPMVHVECCDDCQCVEGHCSTILISNSNSHVKEIPLAKQLFTTDLSQTKSISSSLYKPPILS